jgi:hypothetical protein
MVNNLAWWKARVEKLYINVIIIPSFLSGKRRLNSLYKSKPEREKKTPFISIVRRNLEVSSLILRHLSTKNGKAENEENDHRGKFAMCFSLDKGITSPVLFK